MGLYFEKAVVVAAADDDDVEYDLFGEYHWYSSDVQSV